MNRIFSNGGHNDFVINPLKDLIAHSSHVYLAAPYFTHAELVQEAIEAGKIVRLLVGLNSATSPSELSSLHQVPGVAIRYLTSRFHAKIYLFDDAAVLGSSNLTRGGLIENRESVVCLNRPEDADVIEEVRALFAELWEAGQVLTKERLDVFAETHANLTHPPIDPDAEIEEAVGKAEPPNVSVRSRTTSKHRIFLERLRREVYEQYRPAFNEVTAILEKSNLRRSDFAHLSPANETNRFLNYVRAVHARGEAWQAAPHRNPAERRDTIIRIGQEWVDAADNQAPHYYEAYLENVDRVFGKANAFGSATKDEITQGLMSLHAFTEQQRFVKGGAKSLPSEFWRWNDDNLQRVKSTLAHLLYGSGDFIERLHDILYDSNMKLVRFGYFCALELYGTVKPEECPPMNGRMAKSLRYLGFDVKGGA